MEGKADSVFFCLRHHSPDKIGIIYAYIYALRRGYASGKRFVPRKAAVAFWAAFGGLMIVVAGVSFGIMTATESAAVAAFWSFLCAFFTGIFRCGNTMSLHPLPSRLYPPS